MSRGDDVRARASRLFAAARRPGPSAATQARVRLRLGATRRAPRLRLAWLALLVGAASLTAAASGLALRSVLRQRRSIVIPAVAVPTPAPRSHRKAPPVVTVSAPAPIPVARPTAPVPPPTRRHGAPHVTRTAAVDAAANELLYEAARSLHAQHDAAHAAALVDEYLRRFPDGDLVEEAFALRMEAGAATSPAAARDAARRYLARFPSGRFGEEARARLAAP